MTDIPADAPRSDDGQWWWDGTTWQPVGHASSQRSTAAQAAGLDPQLLEAAKRELQLDGDMEHIAAFAPDDYQRYQEERRILADFVDSAESNNPNESLAVPEEWHKELQLIGGARKDLCNNARVALESRVNQAQQHLESEKHSLERVIAALEDFKEAHEAAEAAEHLSSMLLKVNQLVEVIHEPEKLYKVLEDKVTGSPDDVIEAGIRDLGQYYEQVTLASHGFSSFEDMANYARASVRNVATAEEALGDVVGPYMVAQRDYDIPVTHYGAKAGHAAYELLEQPGKTGTVQWMADRTAPRSLRTPSGPPSPR